MEECWGGRNTEASQPKLAGVEEEILRRGGKGTEPSSITALLKAAPVFHLVHHRYKYLIKKQKKNQPRNLDDSVNTFHEG